MISEEKLDGILRGEWVKDSPDPIPELAEEFQVPSSFMEKRLKFKDQYSQSGNQAGSSLGKRKAMKKTEAIKTQLEELQPTLKERFKVESIGLFGSYLRGEQKKGSDLDILVEFSEPIGLFEFIELEEFLRKELGVKVDLVMKTSLKPRIKERILKEAVYI